MNTELHELIEHLRLQQPCWARDTANRLKEMDAEIIELRRSVSEKSQKLRECRREKQCIQSDLIEEMARTEVCQHPMAIDYKCSVCGERLTTGGSSE